jgi:hypothetical protein
MRLELVGTSLSFGTITEVNHIFFWTKHTNNTSKERFPLLLWLPFGILIDRSKSFMCHGEQFP